MRVFVCASAQFSDETAIEAELDKLPVGVTLVQIAPNEIDNVAIGMARLRDLPIEEERPRPLDGVHYGPRIWYVLMLRVLDTKPDLVLAFRHRRAKAISTIVEEAEGRGIPVKMIDRK